ncbi:MAG: protease inhibitor I42 family protein [Spirochaetes bacterium]|nr:protease inhibitor I42 family protein [Spirochaetota bacterium]
MMKYSFLFVLALCIMMLIFSCKTKDIALNKCTQIVSENMEGKEIVLKKGDVLCVKLLAQLGTGFAWHIDKTSPLIKVTEPPLQIPEGKGGPGSADFQIFQLIAKESGKTDIRFEYKRVWEKNPPLKRFAVAVSIE